MDTHLDDFTALSHRWLERTTFPGAADARAQTPHAIEPRSGRRETATRV